MNDLLNRGEYKILTELVKHKNNEGIINIAINPLLSITKETKYKKPTVYVYMRSLESKGYIEWGRNYYIKILKEYSM